MTPTRRCKRLQLLREAFPRVANVDLLFGPANSGSASQVKDIEEAAARRTIRVTPIELRQAADFEPAFGRGAAVGAQGYLAAAGTFVSSRLQAIVDRNLRSKVPTMFPRNPFAEARG
jgi:ABC-type uncharacterized transport system substrate-binding protein